MTIDVNDKVLYLGLGCGIGLILGALFAPKSGQETRDDLSHRVDDLSHKVRERVQSSGVTDTASQTWRNVVEKGKNVASIGRQRLDDSIEAGRRKFNETIEDEDRSIR
jgi:gas vesicle protein